MPAVAAINVSFVDRFPKFNVNCDMEWVGSAFKPSFTKTSKNQMIKIQKKLFFII